ncbi:YraN family protein [Lysobacteraceae bacterium NML91-0213]|nr:YraN family protein [Xanthomonadaceae bacterium NML91-0213]
MSRRRRGDAVEQLARDLLHSQGLQDVARNAGYRVGELDLVMRDGATLVFVEVRYRRSAGYGGGADSIDARKRLRLVRAAQVFLSRHPRWATAPCRFDVVEGSGEPPRLHWIRDAFRADD